MRFSDPPNNREPRSDDYSNLLAYLGLRGDLSHGTRIFLPVDSALPSPVLRVGNLHNSRRAILLNTLFPSIDWQLFSRISPDYSDRMVPRLASIG